MAQGIEELILSGKFFSPSRSPSPRRSSSSRSPSPDPLWPTNNENSTDSDLSISPPRRGGGFADDDGRHQPTGTTGRPAAGGRTGVKGVLRDRDEAVQRERARAAQEVRETNRRMEKMALSARTYAEEEEERSRERRRLEGGGGGGGNSSSRGEDEDRIRRRMFERSGTFGHLREINMAGFLDAIENEMSETWVLIHIYDPSLQRCHDLDAVLARLARQYPQTKFLRARAGALDFFSSAYPRRSTTGHPQGLVTISERESYGADSGDGDDGDAYLIGGEEGDEESEDATDKDMLPTLLAYRGGELVHTWVRVDWEAESWTKQGSKAKETQSNPLAGVELLLQGHYVIQPSGNGNCGFSSDDDDLDQGPAQDDNDDDLFDL